MRQRATIERKTSTSDTGGGYTEVWSPLVTDSPCLCWTVSGQTIMDSDRPGVMNTRLVHVPRTSVVQVGDRLTQVIDKRGRVLFDGPLLVDTVNEHRDYLELVTRRLR